MDIQVCNRLKYNPFKYEELSYNEPSYVVDYNPFTGKYERFYPLDTYDIYNAKRIRVDNVKRAIDRLYDICRLNKFKYFLTLTFDPSKVDSLDPTAILPLFSHWKSNMCQRFGMQYVLIPEYHKSGRVHFHGLCNGNFSLIDSGKLARNGSKVFNLDNWPYGFSTVIEITNYERTVNYVLKYLKKQLGEDKIFFRRFTYGGSLESKVPCMYAVTDFDSYVESDFKNIVSMYGTIFAFARCQGSFDLDLQSDDQYIDNIFTYLEGVRLDD